MGTKSVRSIDDDDERVLGGAGGDRGGRYPFSDDHERVPVGAGGDRGGRSASSNDHEGRVPAGGLERRRNPVSNQHPLQSSEQPGILPSESSHSRRHQQHLPPLPSSHRKHQTPLPAEKKGQDVFDETLPFYSSIDPIPSESSDHFLMTLYNEERQRRRIPRAFWPTEDFRGTESQASASQRATRSPSVWREEEEDIRLRATSWDDWHGYPLTKVDNLIVRVVGDEMRVARWNMEGFGNHPSNIARCKARDGGFFEFVRQFPAGLSPDYMGGIPFPANTKFAYSSTGLYIDHIERALLLQNSPLLAKGLKNYIKSLMLVTGNFYKYGPSNTPRSTQDYRKAFERWSNEIIRPASEWEFLPPPVKAAFRHRHICLQTGRILWDQQTRCYWYMLDNLALKLAVEMRRTFHPMIQEYTDMKEKLMDWQV